MMLDRINNGLYITMTDDEAAALQPQDLIGLKEILDGFFGTRKRIHATRQMEEFFGKYNMLPDEVKNGIAAKIDEHIATGSNADVG